MTTLIHWCLHPDCLCETDIYISQAELDEHMSEEHTSEKEEAVATEEVDAVSTEEVEDSEGNIVSSDSFNSEPSAKFYITDLYTTFLVRRFLSS